MNTFFLINAKNITRIPDQIHGFKKSPSSRSTIYVKQANPMDWAAAPTAGFESTVGGVVVTVFLAAAAIE